ncbi:MAG: lamin tail domain-containing protein [Planctomycetota bacterium]
MKQKLLLSAAITSGFLFSSQATAQVLINEISTGIDDFIEIVNIGSSAVDISGWAVRSYETRGNSTPCGPSTSASFGLVEQIIVPAGTSIPAGGYLAFDESGTLGNQPTPTIMETGVNIFFFDTTDAEVWIEDASGNVVDYVVFGDVVIDEYINGTYVPVASQWTDTPILRPRDDLDLMVRVLPADTNTAFEWELVAEAGNSTIGAANATVTGPFKGYGLGWSATGNCAPFNNNNWATSLPTLTLGDMDNNTLTPGGQLELSISTGMTTPPLLDILALSNTPLDIPLPLSGCQAARLLLTPPLATIGGLGIAYNAEGAGTAPPLTLPSDPALSGSTFYLQAFILDLGQGACFLRATQGLELRIQ